MATKMNVSLRYGTHLGLLIQAVEKTTGPILELGMGVFSTPYLHYKAILNKRKVVSYENFKPWSDFFLKFYSHEFHEIKVCENWESLEFPDKWDVVLVDQTPDASRIDSVRKLASTARYIIIHDSGAEYEANYHYSEVFPLFKYRKDWISDRNHATILSNFDDLEDFKL